jgi:PIN domain nuclease of toxin-antitoxin system
VIVLDTHAWVWHLSSPEKLGRRARKELTGDEALLVSAISVFEISYKARRGRLPLDRPVSEWITAALTAERIELSAVTGRIASLAGSLDGFHGDPADRLIVATALANRCPLVSADAAITAWAASGGRLRVVW